MLDIMQVSDGDIICKLFDIFFSSSFSLILLNCRHRNATFFNKQSDENVIVMPMVMIVMIIVIMIMIRISKYRSFLSSLI